MTAHLNNSDLRLAVREDVGASIPFSEWFDGVAWQPLMRSPSGDGNSAGAFASAMFLMVPFPNRARANTLAASDVCYGVLPNTEEAFALHGTGWERGWAIVKALPEAACFRLEVGAGYAFPFACEFQIAIAGRTMRFVLAMENTGNEPIPAGLGFHPYFPRLPDTGLEFVAERIFPQGQDLLPLDPDPLPPDCNFADLMHLPDKHLDNAFGGWDGKARISQPSLGYVLEMTASPGSRELMLYAPLGEPYFAFEPQSSTSGETIVPVRSGRKGLYCLQPGQELRIGMELGVAPIE